MELVAEFIQSQTFIYFTKPLLMVVLFIWFYQYANRDTSPRFKTLILFSIVFAFGGDTLLMFVPKNELFFLLGLASFLVAQLFYGVAFLQTVRNSDGYKWDKTDVLIAIWFVIFYSVLMFILFPHLGDYLVPVMLYGLAISFMGVTAAMRSGRVSTQSFKTVLLGAMLFIVSDSIIAFNQFIYNRELWNAQLLIMSTYAIGQYFLIAGSKLHLDANTEQ